MQIFMLWSQFEAATLFLALTKPAICPGNSNTDVEDKKLNLQKKVLQFFDDFL